MPIYEYRCQSCCHELEAIQKVADPQLVDCPACQRPELRKKLTASAFRLSGGGWYETDFKTGDRKRNLSEGGADAKAGGDSAKPAGDGGGASSAPAATTAP